MALEKYTRRKLAYAVGSHALAANIDTRWTGGSGTLTNSAIIIQRLMRHGMGLKAATLFAANLAADSDVVPYTETRLAYTLGSGGFPQAELIDAALGP
jgi:hypothetical protein